MAEAEADLLYREWSDCASVSTGCPKEGTRGSAGALQEGGRGGRRGRKGGDLMRQMAMEAGRCRPRVGCGLCRRRAEEGALSIEHRLPLLWGRAERRETVLEGGGGGEGGGAGSAVGPTAALGGASTGKEGSGPVQLVAFLLRVLSKSGRAPTSYT